jgi:pyridoxamine 5'-phosphate oxidase
MNSDELAGMRRDFTTRKLTEELIEKDPFDQISLWMREAIESRSIDPNAMTLATVDADCRPSSRIVLLKGFDKAGFTFFTNYESKKARDLAENPNAVLHFFWAELERQVIICGQAAKVSHDETEANFFSRPLESRIGAWASKQSSRLENREQLEKRVEELRRKFSDGNVPLPPFWGGYRVVPESFEFWQGRASRLHDRICFTLEDNDWRIFRLSP